MATTTSLPSDEVAEDYKASLEDLAINSRYEISNLTVIAKENTEHAHAISRVLENHIKSCPPSRKLPALYVLDSVVKNVGTPYTLFLGRNLFNIFMLAYTQVESPVRRKLDEMLKTWKEPVPGALDPRPVFPTDVTRPIETALIKARTQYLQKHGQDRRPEVQARPGTSTPPVGWNASPMPYANGRPPSAQHGLPPNPVRSPYPPNGSNSYQGTSHDPRQSHPLQNSQYPTSQAYQAPYQPPTPSFPPRNVVDMDELKRDIEGDISVAQGELANSPYDEGVQNKLKALLDLQNILNTQQLPQEHLEAVRKQITRKSAPAPLPMPKPTPPPISTPSIPNAPYSVQQAGLNPEILNLLKSTNLADLIKSANNRQQPTPPPPSIQAGLPFQPPAMISTPPVMPVIPTIPVMPSAAPMAQSNSLLASLRAAGILGPSPVAPTALSGKPKIDIPLTSASMKISRPQLVPNLYAVKSNQCITCGRRFFPSAEGKEKKARHLDWHFKTGRRRDEAVKRGQNRSWFVDEHEWTKSREGLDEDETEGDKASNQRLSTEAAKKEPEKKWIIAPNDPALRNLPCPICQEKFDSTWSEEVQDWIWQDALKVGEKIYHPSCYRDVTKDRGATPVRDTTPDSILGKRKAEDADFSGIKSKIKVENPIAS